MRRPVSSIVGETTATAHFITSGFQFAGLNPLAKFFHVKVLGHTVTLNANEATRRTFTAFTFVGARRNSLASATRNFTANLFVLCFMLHVKRRSLVQQHRELTLTSTDAHSTAIVMNKPHVIKTGFPNTP